jgi:hypothetical protein
MVEVSCSSFYKIMMQKNNDNLPNSQIKSFRNFRDVVTETD